MSEVISFNKSHSFA